MATLRNRPTTNGVKADKASSILPVHFADDSLTRVSRTTLKSLSRKLGFNETQTVHYALACLRNEIVPVATTAPSVEEDYPPLTQRQLDVIRAQQPRRRKAGKVESLIR